MKENKKNQVLKLVRECMVEDRGYTTKELKDYVERQMDEVLSSSYLNVTLTRECDNRKDIEKVDKGIFRKVQIEMSNMEVKDFKDKGKDTVFIWDDSDISLDVLMKNFADIEKLYCERYKNINAWESPKKAAEVASKVEKIQLGIKKIKEGLAILKNAEHIYVTK